jgi:hypothetical protein
LGGSHLAISGPLTLTQVRFLRDQVIPSGQFGLGHVLLVLLLLLLAADRLVEQDGADADADSHASTPASTTTTAMATG